MKQHHVIKTLSSLVESMPLSDVEIAGVVKGLVDEGYLHPSAPPSTTNYFLQQALFDINKQIRKIV